MFGKIVCLFASLAYVNCQLYALQSPCRAAAPTTVLAPILPPQCACSPPILPPPCACSPPVLPPPCACSPPILPPPCSCGTPILPPSPSPCGCKSPLAPLLETLISLPYNLPVAPSCYNPPVLAPAPCGCNKVLVPQVLPAPVAAPVVIPNLPCSGPVLPPPCGCSGVPNMALVSAANAPRPPCGCAPEVTVQLPVGCTNPYLPAASPVSAMAPQVVSPVLPPVCPCENRCIYLRKIPIPPPSI